MTESTYRMRLLSVHPLDAPVVALAASMTEDAHTRRRGRVTAVGAVKCHGSRELDTFHAADASAMTALAGFADGSPIVAHALADALGEDAASSLSTGVWDVRELAELLMPASADDSLVQLAGRLGVAASGHPHPDRPPSRGRGPEPSAVADARLTYAVYLELVERARGLGAGLLRRLADLLARAHSPLADLVFALAESPAAADAGPIGGIDPQEIARRLERPRSLGMPKPTKPVTADEVRRLLANDGPFAQRFRRYEARGEQAEMAEAVARAFGSTSQDAEPHHLLVEGGTGIGKSVAYLLPAVLFALRNNVRVVVSTNTINLQEQLIGKDIPDLLDVLRGVPGLDVSNFRYAQLKGKANYLCLRRWEAMANGDAASPDDARTMAKTLAWLRETRTGDRAELRLSGAELGSWDRMSATGFAMCTGAREGACFYRHARDEAGSAHLLVVNHSLLLSNLQVSGSLLPDYDYLIVDEAHNLEAEATRQFGFRVSQATVENLVERLGGVIHGFGTFVRTGALEQSRRESAELRSEEAQMPLYKVRDEWAQLTAGLAKFTAEQRAGESDEGELRITASERAQPAWSALDIAWDGFECSAAEASERADALLREMESLPPETAPVLEPLKGELSEWLVDQAEARQKIRSFVSQPDADTVYWVGRGDNLSLNGAPLDVAPRLREELFAPKPTVVLTSATLTVAGGFAHVRTRLGVEEPGEVCLGSPFDYRNAALLCLPTDVPEPNDPRYTDAVASVLERLAHVAEGRTMALFTSHAAVRATASRLRRVLPKRGIGVLAQGVDGTPQQLLARFRARPRAVLLGTASFWEGVDVGNETLKVLVVARLPFNVPTEPIFAARSGQYEQPFMQYAVPQAVLRFRQGFGRLIRSKGDRGVAVVLDSRITSKFYGRMFLNSMPPATIVKGRFDELAPAVGRWLALQP
ncbi:MAG: hypothetical protein OXL97_01635 [Chloroflexota bacterium]|nr:hypothetical protein [Chloroflexota bacterium]MDE2886009.1 hypothetical protein [Chloroflexota bacterium]